MRSVTSTAAKNQLGQVLETALTEPVTITKTGRKVAVLLSWKEYERLQALEDAWWAREAARAESEGYLGARATRRVLREPK
jgi:prevent-host-death family protein